LLGLGILIPPAASGAGWLTATNGTRQAEIQLAATDSACSTWFGQDVYERRVNRNKLDSPCQPRTALL